MRSDPELFAPELLSTGSPAWAALYLAGTVVLTVWTRRAAFRQGGRAAAIGVLDVLASVCLSIPALAYWNADIATRLGEVPLGVLFGLGLLGLCGFARHDARTAMRNPRLMPRRRKVVAAIAVTAILLPAAPEVWWGGSALAHVQASPEKLPKSGV
jgi:ferric-dicitrate binding protein FerR (iron transport regulator)